MAERWTSGCRSCLTRAAVGRSLLATALFLVALHAGSAQAPESAGVLSLTSRAMQPGELVVATVAAPERTEGVSVTAFGATWTGFQTPDGRWQVLLGIDLDTRPGSYPVDAEIDGPTVAHAGARITVVPKRFRRRTLRVSPEFVSPPPDTQVRIVSEATLLREVYTRVGPEPGWRDGFVRPVPDAANSAFGTRSVFNGQPRNPHAGTDFLSAAGTPIRAPASGHVALARDLFFTGNTVIIDHGLGVFSMLAHLSHVDVMEGQAIAAGDVVGRVGATGRVTGPHLHWALRVGAARVDALSALALLGRSR